MPKISVIIPVYNVEKYLRECIESVERQTFNDLEIICVNDGSTDSSQSILDEYASKDERFVILNQTNQGLSAARNSGLNAAVGDYISFLDSDDYILDADYYEKLYDACKRNSADIAVASIIRGDDKKSEHIFKICEEQSSDDYCEKLKICDVPDTNFVWNKLYKRESLLSTGIIFPTGKLYEDLYFTPQILYYMKKIVSVAGINYFYRKRKDSIIHTESVKAQNDYKEGRKLLISFFNEHGIDISEHQTNVKKIKLFGITLFKSLEKYNKRKNILFNLIKWEG